MNGGAIVTVLGFSKVHATAHSYDYSESTRFAWSLIYVGLLVVAGFAVGLPDLRSRRRDAWSGALLASTAAGVGISLLQLLSGSALLPRFVVFGSAVTMVPCFVGCARLAADGADRERERDRAILVAPPSEQVQLRDELGRAPERSARLVGALTPEEAGLSAGPVGRLAVLATAQRATVVVLSRDAQLVEPIVAQAAELHGAGVRVRTLSLFYEEWLGKLPASELERVALLFDIGEVHRLRYGRLKRVLDVGLGVVGALLLCLVVPVVLVGNRIGNRGPLLFRQERVGKLGRRFVIWKFRTMRHPDRAMDPSSGSWTEGGDPRVTRFGRVMRSTHVDELPQVVNILRGDLSVVGPRPEQPRYVDELVGKLPFYDLRHLVRPGLTGWAQLKYGYAGDERDALEKLQYEFFYLRHQRLAFDLRILARTIRAVVGRDGR